MSRLDRIRAFAAASPHDPFAAYSLAMELKKTDLAEAIGTFRRLRLEHPSYVPTYYQLGRALEEAGLPDEAKEAYQAGIGVARAGGDAHAAGELAAALDLL